MQTSILILLTLGIPGLILFIVGAFMRLAAEKRNDKCTAQSTGIVIDYYRKGSLSHGDFHVGPVVEFKNEHGNSYTARKNFAGVVRKTDSRRVGLENGMYEDSKGVLRITTGRSGLSEEAMAENLWPLGSEMTVYYDPSDPSVRNYVDKPVNSKVLPNIFMLTGIAFVVLSGIMYFVSEL